MADDHSHQNASPDGGPQPVFLIPGVITALAGVITAIHVAAQFIFNMESYLRFVGWFGFIPYRFIQPGAYPGGVFGLIWTPFTYALLHAGWEHLIFNMVWLIIFGTPLARRYGGGPTLFIFFAGSLVGALTFAVLSGFSTAPLIGASGGIAAFTGAAVRFVFQPVEIARHPETGEVVVLGRRLLSLWGVMRDKRAGFFSFVWIALNCLVPLLPALSGGGASVQIAWQAHLGGFLFGLLIVPIFERRPKAGPGQESEA